MSNTSRALVAAKRFNEGKPTLHNGVMNDERMARLSNWHHAFTDKPKKSREERRRRFDWQSELRF